MGLNLRAPSSHYADPAGCPRAATKNMSANQAVPAVTVAQRISGGRASSSPTSTAMRLPLTTTVPVATGRLLARMWTASSSADSNSMMAPRPSRSTWWIGIEVVPSTTVISTETLSNVLTVPLPVCAPRMNGACFKSPWYGERVVNARNELTVGLPAPAGSAPVEWRVSDALVSYEDAVAFMEARVAGVAASRSWSG